MSLKVLYLGMLGDFSRIPLAALLAASVDVCGVVVPGQKTAGGPPIMPLPPPKTVTSLPLLTPYSTGNIVHLAWEQGIPAWEMRRPGHPATLAALADLRPDVAVVACFSRRIPPVLLALPRHGFLNLHPSLLPAYRGPNPVFWQLRLGETETGVTLHFMDEGLDTGDIVRQARVAFPDGSRDAELDRLLAAKGVALLPDVLAQLAAGTLSRRPQPAGGRAQPAPQPADFCLDMRWSARRAFDFMRGTVDWGRPYPITVAGQTIQLQTALAYEPDTVLAEPFLRDGRDVWIQFSPGVVNGRPIR